MKRKIAIVYDTSFLMGNYQSVKKLIQGWRFAIPEKAGGFLGSLVARLKKKEGAAQVEGDALFVILEVVPTEVLKNLERLGPDGAKGQKAVAELVANGASKVRLALDSLVGDLVAGVQEMAEDTSGLSPEERRRKLLEQIVYYADRLVAHQTPDSYNLAVVLTEDANLLARLDERTQLGRAVLGLTSEQLTGTQVLHEQLAEIARQEHA